MNFPRPLKSLAYHLGCHKPLVICLDGPQHLFCLFRAFKIQGNGTQYFMVPLDLLNKHGINLLEELFSFSNAIVAPAAIL